jgi:hypothetical protein
VDVAKQLDDRDAVYKAEITTLKGQIAELVDEREQRDGQLKKTQEMLVTSEAQASDACGTVNIHRPVGNPKRKV